LCLCQKSSIEAQEHLFESHKKSTRPLLSNWPHSRFKTMQKFTAIGLIAISVILGAGCANSLSTGKVSGLYEFDSGHQDTETVCFVLSPDGTYALGNADAPAQWMSFSGTPSRGQWQLTDSGRDQQLLIGNSKFPIKQTSSGVRVVVDADRGMYCDFAKPK